ncbi:MAG: hypothetical protein ACOYOA_05185 [Saprospiraceae bacterium]
MNSREFLISKINQIIQQYPQLKAIYEYSVPYDLHLVEFFPADFHENCPELIREESHIIGEFIQLFEDEDVCFFSGDDMLVVENPTYEAKGKDYVEPVTEFAKSFH